MISPQTFPKLGVRVLQHLIDQNYHRRCREVAMGPWVRSLCKDLVQQGSHSGGFL